MYPISVDCYPPYEIIIEVNRELNDASFENLISAYGEQTAIYQATNVNLGFMLVFGLSKDRPNTAHLDTYYEIRRGDLVRDGTDRAVMILKVPGRRGTPSLATKKSKGHGKIQKSVIVRRAAFRQIEDYVYKKSALIPP